MKFKYIAYNKNGKKIKGIIEANSLEEAKIYLKNYYLLEIKEKKYLIININLSKTIPKKNLSKTLKTLGLYLKASIPLINAITLTKNSEENTKVIKFLDKIQKEIKEGKNFYNAINSTDIKLPKYVINAIKVGEESGKLDIVLIEIAKFLKEEEKIISKTKQSLIYPTFIITVAIFMIAFMLTTVVPKIVNIFKNIHQNLPTITVIVIKISHFLQNNYQIILLISFLILFTFYIAYSKISKFRYLIDSLILKTPIVNKIILSKELGRFSYLVYVLTNSGVTYVNAVYLATNSIENEKLKIIFNKALKSVNEGKKLSISLQKEGFVYNKSFIQALALAEETSEIENILNNLSEIYFEENESKISTFLSILEPTLIVIIGSIIGFIITALLLPMFSINLIQ
jgi:type II secretory pathway component PulF